MLTPKAKISHLDARRDVIIPGNLKTTLTFCIEHLINAYHSSVEDHGAFYLCLSGGSTPKALFRMLTASPYKEQIDWGKIHPFGEMKEA